MTIGKVPSPIWLVLFFCYSSGAYTQPLEVNRLFNYGDSLTDQNNTYSYTGFLLKKESRPALPLELYPAISQYLPTWFLKKLLIQIPPEPYYRGRFSDGRNFMEQLAEYMGVEDQRKGRFINYAHGGSATINNPIFVDSLKSLASSNRWGWSWAISQAGTYTLEGQMLFPSLYDQVQFSIQKYGHFDPNDVFVISSGSNDNKMRFWNPRQVIEIQEKAIIDLYEAGARVIFWESIPDFTLAPCLKTAPDVDNFKQTVLFQNCLMRTSVTGLRQRYPDLKLVFIDTARIFFILLDEAKRLGMDTETSCTKIAFRTCTLEDSIDMLQVEARQDEVRCNHSEHFFFFDAAHLTKRVNEWIALLVCRLLVINGISVHCPSEAYGNREEFAIEEALKQYYRQGPVFLPFLFRVIGLEDNCF